MNRIALHLYLVLSAFLLTTNLNAQQGNITITGGCPSLDFCFNAGKCDKGLVYIKLGRATTCANSSYTDVSYKLDLNNDGSIEQQTFADSIRADFPKGTHRVSWRVTDNCGNLATCNQLFTVKDCTLPTLTCINGLTQNLSLPNCTTTFEANKFILVLSDNCTPANQIQLGIRRTDAGTGFPNTTSVTFDKCEVGLQTVEVWAKDGNGLLNICQNYVIVQDNGNECPCDKESDVSASGCISTYAPAKRVSEWTLRSRLEPVTGVSNPTTKHYKYIGNDSCYALKMFPAIPNEGSYRLIMGAERNFAPLNGVSTYDLVVTSKHILGLESFTNIYQLAAADVNRSNSVTTLDIVETRKLILGIYDTFPETKSWRFVQALPNPTSWTTLEVLKDTFQIPIPNLSADLNLKNMNFVAIKSGDVNGSALTNFQDPPTEDRNDGEPLVLEVPDLELSVGESAELPFYPMEFAALDGWQMNLQLDLDKVELEDITGVDIANVHLAADGSLKIIQFEHVKNAGPNTPLFTLKIRAKSNTRSSEVLFLHDSGLYPEAYSGQTLREIRLSQPKHIAKTQFFPPVPNPSNGELHFSILMPNAGVASLRVTDIQGKTIFEKAITLAPGMQQILLEKGDLPYQNLFFYQIQVNGESYSGRIVRNL